MKARAFLHGKPIRFPASRDVESDKRWRSKLAEGVEFDELVHMVLPFHAGNWMAHQSKISDGDSIGKASPLRYRSGIRLIHLRERLWMSLIHELTYFIVVSRTTLPPAPIADQED